MAVEHVTNTAEMKDTAVYGVAGVFDRPEDLIRAGRELHHTLGYTKIDAYSPFPLHGIDVITRTQLRKGPHHTDDGPEQAHHWSALDHGVDPA